MLLTLFLKAYMIGYIRISQYNSFKYYIRYHYILLTLYLKSHMIGLYVLINIISKNIILDYGEFIVITIFSG